MLLKSAIKITKSKWCFFFIFTKKIIMKVKLLIPLKIDGKNIESGEMVEANDMQIQSWKKRGWIETTKKEVKQKKETKELKIDSKETK